MFHKLAMRVKFYRRLWVGLKLVRLHEYENEDNLLGVKTLTGLYIDMLD